MRRPERRPRPRNGALSRLDLTEQLPAVSAFGVEIRRRAAVQRAYELGMKRGQLVAHGLKFLAVPAEQLRDSDRHVVGGRGRQPGRGARRRSGRFPKRRADGRQIPAAAATASGTVTTNDTLFLSTGLRRPVISPANGA